MCIKSPTEHIKKIAPSCRDPDSVETLTFNYTSLPDAKIDGVSHVPQFENDLNETK